jgi:hypothetical protein
MLYVISERFALFDSFSMRGPIDYDYLVLNDDTQIKVRQVYYHREGNSWSGQVFSNLGLFEFEEPFR